jgi:hypothetical protein
MMCGLTPFCRLPATAVIVGHGLQAAETGFGFVFLPIASASGAVYEVALNSGKFA